MNDNRISIIELLAGKIIASGATYAVPKLIEVYAYDPNGNFSMQLELDVAGTTGTATIFYKVTNNTDGLDADRFIKPVDSDIFTAFAKTDGEDADGRDLVDFNVETCHQVQICVTANGGDIKIDKLIAAVQ